MVHEFSVEQVNSFLFQKHHLAGAGPQGDVVQTVWDVGGLHATAAGAPYLSLWTRLSPFEKGDLERALYYERTLGKIPCMRDTLFILPKELLPVAYQATLKGRETLIARYPRASHVSSRECEHWMPLILDSLASGPKTSAEIAREIGERQAFKATLAVAANDWRVIRTRPRGTWRSNQHEYAIFATWFPDVDLNSIRSEEARVHLVRHYLAAFGPAREDDIAWWAGFSKAETSAGLRSLGKEVVTVHISDLPGDFMVLAAEISRLESAKAGRPAFLLPALDPLMMGYKDRQRFLSPELYGKVFDPGGNALPTVWIDGRVIGVWQEERSPACLTLLLLQDIAAPSQRALEAETNRLGKFLGYEPTRIKITPYPPGAYPKSPFSVAQREND